MFRVFNIALLLVAVVFPVFGETSEREKNLELGMKYQEVLSEMGRPEHIASSLGLTSLSYSQCTQNLWFQNGRLILMEGFCAEEDSRVEKYRIRHSHFPGQSCREISSPAPPYSELITARRDEIDRSKFSVFILGQSVGEASRVKDESYVPIYDGGFLRGLRGATVVCFGSGFLDAGCASITFRVGHRATNNAPENGWYSPLPSVKLRMVEGSIAEIELYMEDEPLFKALRQI